MGQSFSMWIVICILTTQNQWGMLCVSSWMKRKVVRLLMCSFLNTTTTSQRMISMLVPWEYLARWVFMTNEIEKHWPQIIFTHILCTFFFLFPFFLVSCFFCFLFLFIFFFFSERKLYTFLMLYTVEFL